MKVKIGAAIAIAILFFSFFSLARGQSQSPTPGQTSATAAAAYSALWQDVAALLVQVNGDHSMLSLMTTQLNTVSANQAGDETNIATLQKQIAALQAAAVFPKQIAYVAQRNQTAAIPSSPLVTVSTTALYQFLVSSACKGTGTVDVTISFTDPYGNSQNDTTGTATCPGSAYNTRSFSVAAGAAITYSVAITGTPTFDAVVEAVQQGQN